MSWWISVNDPDGTPLIVEPFEAGGTYAMGGSSEADLNVTYNYGKHYYRVLGLEDGLRGLDGMKAEDAVPILERGIAELGDETDPDYWKPTEGNAKAALITVKSWCEQSLKQETPAFIRVS